MEDSDYVIVAIIVVAVFVLIGLSMYFSHQEKCIAQVKDKPAAEIHLICKS